MICSTAFCPGCPHTVHGTRLCEHVYVIRRANILTSVMCKCTATPERIDQFTAEGEQIRKRLLELGWKEGY